MTLPQLLLAHACTRQAFRIAPNDTNYFVILHGPDIPGFDHVCVIEIFEKDGKTPPNSHQRAFEFFYVLSGKGQAHCGGHSVDIAKGNALLLPPGDEHVIENVGEDKLYTLTVMMPDEAFAALIRAGTPVQLDDEDRAVLADSAAP